MLPPVSPAWRAVVKWVAFLMQLLLIEIPTSIDLWSQECDLQRKFYLFSAEGDLEILPAFGPPSAPATLGSQDAKMHQAKVLNLIYSLLTFSSSHTALTSWSLACVKPVISNTSKKVSESRMKAKFLLNL
ncbi:hypothetical protein P7K49_030287, partial [Saguinus oedipus]